MAERHRSVMAVAATAAAAAGAPEVEEAEEAAVVMTNVFRHEGHPVFQWLGRAGGVLHHHRPSAVH